MTRIVKKAADRRLEIVETARQLFQENEYEKTTIQDVMDQLGIAKGTIYHYFQSKEQLLEAVIEKIVNDDIERKQELIKDLKGNAIENIRSLLETNTLAADNNEILEQLHQPGNVGMHTRLLAVTLLKQAPLYAELIRQGCAEGLFQTDYPLECAEFILTATQFLSDMGIYPWTQAELIRRLQAFPRLIEAQLKASHGSFQFMVEQMQAPDEPK
jgi:AcrR family transcriptional regulator